MNKKMIKVGTVFILLIALIAVCNSASASTKNSEMPLCKDVLDWKGNLKFSKGNFVNSAYDSYIEMFPAGHTDKIQDSGGNVIGVVFYYYDPESSKEYGSMYYDINGNEMGIGCNSGCTLTDSYTGVSKKVVETKSKQTKTKEKIDKIKIYDETKDLEEDDEEEEDDIELGNTYADLLKFLDKDNTNKKGFGSSRECSEYLINELPSEFQKDAKLVKAYFKKGDNGKYRVRYCVGIETSDEGTVYIDSYSGKAGNGIDKRVTVLKAGQRWQAESADGTCPYDETGRYNRGKVLKIKIIGE